MTLTLSKMVFKKSGFAQKFQNFVHFGLYELIQITTVCGPNTYLIMHGDLYFRLPESAFAAVARKSFNGEFTAKLHF